MENWIMPKENWIIPKENSMEFGMDNVRPEHSPSGCSASNWPWNMMVGEPAVCSSQNSSYLNLPPPSYELSVSQHHSAQSAQPTFYDGSAYPYQSNWEESFDSYSLQTDQNSVSPPIAAGSFFQNPPTSCSAAFSHPVSGFQMSYSPVNYLQTSYAHHGSLSVLDESPISSPESLDSFPDSNESPYSGFEGQSILGHPHSNAGILNTDSPTIQLNYEMQTSYPQFQPLQEATYHQEARQPEAKPLKKALQMPQRKGGIQLWQFLYSLLTNSKYHDIIQWTSNRLLNEFQLLEPESIAVWWGTLKSKPMMTYDKFSRSLRYYYHKGILKKIQGNRYVYQFLIDPEDMYKYIGTSNRPDIKSMPKEAKMAMLIFQKTTSIERKCEKTPKHSRSQTPFITKPTDNVLIASRNSSPIPTALSNKYGSSSSDVSIHSFVDGFTSYNSIDCMHQIVEVTSM